MEGGKNPFLENWKFPVSKGSHPTRFKLYPDGIRLRESIFFEQTAFTRVFHDPISKGRVQQLSDRAQRMYLYILYHAKNNMDYIVLDPEVYMSYFGIKSPTTFKLAKMELTDANFIAKANPRKTYWINPARFFCGSRPNTFPHNREITNEI